MKVTSTEFQQKVGYYLGLVDEGETVEIEKQKPRKRLYEIKPKKVHIVNDKPRKNKWEKILDEIDEMGGISADYGNDAVKFIRNVRS